MRRALILVHEPGGGACQIGRRLTQRGVAVDSHVITADLAKPNDAAPFPDHTPYDLLISMGSIHSLTRKHEIDSWIQIELDLLCAAHEARTPILGVCFGGQALADALGGMVEPAPIPEIGWFEIREAKGAVNPIGPGPWFEWHQDRFIPPPDAEVLARTEHATQLFRLDRAVGTQFHPEIDVGHVQAWLAETPDEYLDEVGCDRDQLLAEVVVNEAANITQCHQLVDWFLDRVAFPTNETLDVNQ